MEVHGVYLCQIIVFGIISLFQICDGFCFRANLMAEMTVSMRLRYYCEYKPLHGSSTRLFPGSNLYLVDQCLQCSCSMDGLQCCGFGHAGAAIAFKKDCKMLLDGCQPLMVKKDNHTLDCFTGQPINITALSEQQPHPDNVNVFETVELPKQVLAESVTPGVENPPLSVTTTTPLAPKQLDSSTSLAPPTRKEDSTTPSTLSPTSLANQETTTVAPATNKVFTIATAAADTAEAKTPAPETTTTTTTTTGASHQSYQQNDMQAQFADYMHFLMYGTNTGPNYSGLNFFSPFFNPGNSARDTSFPSTSNSGNNMQDVPFLPTQPPHQRSNRIWQHDYFLPWLWFI